MPWSETPRDFHAERAALFHPGGDVCAEEFPGAMCKVEVVVVLEHEWHVRRLEEAKARAVFHLVEMVQHDASGHQSW